MDYLKIFIGLVLIVVLSLVLFKNIKRKGLVNSLIQFDTLTGLIVGVYVLVTSVQSVIS